uniref:Uncharacterized protein n=1 Tax=Arundo donax TaxID=35708 RepID=A0A0A9EZJ9_ARUDO
MGAWQISKACVDTSLLWQYLGTPGSFCLDPWLPPTKREELFVTTNSLFHGFSVPPASILASPGTNVIREPLVRTTGLLLEPFH